LLLRWNQARDSALIEAGLRFAQAYILGRKRRITPIPAAECNAAMTAPLERMNGREIRRLSREIVSLR
jgi:hypothetical protein